MKTKFTFFYFLITLLFILNSALSQTDDPRWNINYKPFINNSDNSLPSTEKNLQQNQTTRIYHTPGYDFLVPPNIRPYPSTASQKTVDATSMTGNQNIIYASWNSWNGSTYYGTGFCFTSNGGINWIGSDQMLVSGNNGDPGVWIWSAASSWPGRLGFTVIGASGISASYSTNSGSSWSTFVNVGGSSVDIAKSCVDDVTGSPFLGRAYCVWTDFGGTYVNRICGAYSSNGGVSWAGYGPVSPPPVSGHHCQGCDICVGPGGVVYTCWANCLTNAQNSTEDSLGFAKSTNGGVSWIVTENNAVDINGIRALHFLNGFRVNGFPRIAVDKSGGSRNGWIYVTLSEKFISPARDSADVTLCRSTNGGLNWTHTLVNTDAAGNYQWLPSLAINPSGNIGIGYYDTRGLPFPSIQYYLSFSSNGGNTWNDMLVSDHTFIAGSYGINPAEIGSYTGIAYGNGKFWPFWMDDYLDPTGRVYQVWTVGITPVAIKHNSEQVPTSFHLYQNYPNPFNPTTKIKFNAPPRPSPKERGQNVKLIIYDILGNEVATLVNEKLSSGTYEVEWNASNFAGGVYFYKLQSGSITETRKMILMK